MGIPTDKWLPLIGVLLVVAGFALRLHPMLVVVTAGVVTGLLSHLGPVQVLSLLGEAFLKNRFLFLFVLTLPVVGLLEGQGLRERAEALMQEPLQELRPRTLTPGRLLFLYQLLRQATAAFGLTSLGGHPQTVRPLLAPMVLSAAERLRPDLDARSRERLLGLCAASDNIALFFGEDLFVAFGAVLLMQGVFRQQGIALEPLHLALFGLPVALAALLFQGLRLYRLDRQLSKRA
jgi:uncharacterized membrane protein